MDRTYAYVALLDVLGYRALLAEDRKKGSAEFKDRLQAALAILATFNEGQFPYQAISDTVIVSCPNRDEFEAFCGVIREIYISFLRQSLLIRGGISYAQHFKSGPITYSHAVASAYKVESERAIVPRICIAPDVIELQVELEKYEQIRNLVAVQNGTFFLDIASAENHREIYELAKGLYQAEEGSLLESESGFMKHLWLEYYLSTHSAAAGRAKRRYITPPSMIPAKQAPAEPPEAPVVTAPAPNND